ncbi:MAG: bifunctional phosphoglucose/phosphomannose isomerase [Ignisphaera sp.]|uniref:Bifunctional phosphoglucose/phosphomannose isomerase n=1 Tax=Ignisphaera aggregans TaxID=334771 RepID=A0A7J3IA33_9CREN
MLEHYMKWYEYSLEALGYTVVNARFFDGIRRIVILGMGGSGIVGDIIASIAAESEYPVYVYKDFYIPSNIIDGTTFVLSISYSGNTLETILSTKKALQHTKSVGVIASGGELIELAKRNGLPYIAIRSGLAPRSALPIMLVAAFNLLSTCGIELIAREELMKALDVLKNMDEAERTSRELFNFLKLSKLPLVVATLRYSALAVRIKNELNENSKIPVKVEILPELFHNDIVGWESAEFKDKALLVDSDLTYENKLIQFYAEYLKGLGIDTYILRLNGNVIERFLYGSLVIGITSIKLAQLRGLDPLQTKSISIYKQLLQELKEEIERVAHSR